MHMVTMTMTHNDDDVSNKVNPLDAHSYCRRVLRACSAGASGGTNILHIRSGEVSIHHQDRSIGAPFFREFCENTFLRSESVHEEIELTGVQLEVPLAKPTTMIGSQASLTFGMTLRQCGCDQCPLIIGEALGEFILASLRRPREVVEVCAAR